MKKFPFFILAALLFAFSTPAQKPSAANALEQNLRKHVEYLASPQLEGRRTGEPGATAAAGYIVNQFAQLKLKPGYAKAGAKPGFLQPFPYVAGVTLAEGSFLNITPANPENVSKLEPGITYMPLANSIGGEVPSSPLVFAGYGITTADKKYDDYAGLDVRNKVVIVFDGSPEAGSREHFGALNLHAKANLARERGARALIVIVRSDDFKTDRLSHLAYEPTLGETAIPVVAIDRGIAADVFGVRTAAEVSEIEKWIAMKINAPPAIAIKLAEPLKATAQMKIGLEKRTVEAYNVIGILEGRDPQLKNEAIVIGAHYDHLGRGGRSSLSPGANEIHHGADDNASGTAAVIELARQFAGKNPHGSKGVLAGRKGIVRNKRTIIFVAFGGEEEGLLGSKHYVNNPVWPLDKTIAMINLDMVGRLNENKLTVSGIGTAEEWQKKVTGFNSMLWETIKTGLKSKTRIDDVVVGQAESRFNLQLNEDGFGPSDHSSFYGKRIPVLFFFTGTHADYHKPSDTSEKINYAGLARIVSFVEDIVANIDETATGLTYKTAQSTPTSGRMTFNVFLGTIPSYGDTNDGLLIDGVREGSPAAKAGLKGGDKIVKLAGKDVRNISDYMFALSTMKAGQEYEIVILRAGQTLTLKITPAPPPPVMRQLPRSPISNNANKFTIFVRCHLSAAACLRESTKSLRKHHKT